MPAGYPTIAQALPISTSSSALSSSPSPSQGHIFSEDTSPSWTRANPGGTGRRGSSSSSSSSGSHNVLEGIIGDRNGSSLNNLSTSSSSNSRRLSTPYSSASAGNGSNGSSSSGNILVVWGRWLSRSSFALMQRLVKLGESMTPLQRVLWTAGGLAVLALTIVFLVFAHKIYGALGPVAESWRAIPGGWILLFLLTSLTAFPPMLGYSTTLTIAGFVYGFPAGWPIVASATVFGSTAAFLTSRTVLSKYVHRLVGSDTRFVALAQVLRHDGLWVLVAIRLCPLPFSLSNGFLATIPSITPLSFALATALSTVKLLVHVFIGSRLALLAESGDDMSMGDRVINYLSIAFGGALGTVLGIVIYRRTMKRAKQLAREDAAESGVLISDDEARDLSYEDLEEGVLERSTREFSSSSSRDGNRAGEEDAAALMMDDDDISLWENDVSMENSSYRDDETVAEQQPSNELLPKTNSHYSTSSIK